MSDTIKHVVVLKGGWSSERQVSLSSGAECARALRESGKYKVTELDVGRDVAEKLTALKPDVAFNALHGPWGEDGCIQGVLEILNIPYTHSGVMASALAMDKPRTKIVLAQAGLDVAKDVRFKRKEIGKDHPLPPPYVIKPSAEGSSVGVFMVGKDETQPPQALYEDNWDLSEDLMAEEYIPGRELTVAVMNGRALAVTEIIPTTGYYDYEAKYATGGSSHVIPADVPKDVYECALEMALTAHNALGCKGLTRTDFRYDDQSESVTNTQTLEQKFKLSKGRLVVLETNTQPGMTPTSLAPEQAAHVGMSFPQLCQAIVEDASRHR